MSQLFQSNITKIFIILVLVCFSLSCQREVSNTLTKAEATIILDQYMETLIRGDTVLIDEIIAPDFELHSPLLPEPVKGINAYKNLVRNNLNTFSEFNATIDEVVVNGDTAWGRFSMEGINTGPFGNLPPTGKKFQITGLAMTRIVDGKVVKDETYWNVLDFYQQLGFTLAPPEN